MLVEQDVLELEVAMDAVLLMNVCDSADELAEGLLDLVDRELSVPEEVIVELLA